MNIKVIEEEKTEISDAPVVDVEVTVSDKLEWKVAE